ncbi:MAG: hypothetical protein E6J90_02100 [Deltaproteobacteria bacterium]|nr:MAG: hypothetical protein E6J91_07980 [Deltaproteobacteria bacterium]TMQ27651.1 MAG: hypothetical protein E6J90_02100 [Deltaproteobacteria bacterium]
MNLLGNLDCEAGWSGAALPEGVRRRISLYAALFAACVPPDSEGDGDGEGDSEGDGNGGGGEPHQLWAPAPVDPARLIAHPGWTPPIMRVAGPSGPQASAPDRSPADAPGRFGLAWADPAARAANDRSRTLAIAQALGVALPGARVVASLAELDEQLGGFAGRPWICKARWTAAGRDRARGAGSVLDGELRARIGRMLARLGPLVFEPWLDRVADLGVCGAIGGGEVALREPHRLITDPRGGFLGIELAPIEPAIAEPFAAVARAAASRLAVETGYRGPFAVDGFVYRDRGAHHLHPLCELNARHSFGWIAHGLARRLGIRRLGFDAPPPGATVLIAPGDDRVTAWCT